MPLQFGRGLSSARLTEAARVLHSRPVENGAPVKLWALTCPQCEDHLRHDPLWSGTINELPETYDEQIERERREKNASAEQEKALGNLPGNLAGALGPALAAALAPSWGSRRRSQSPALRATRTRGREVLRGMRLPDGLPPRCRCP